MWHSGTQAGKGTLWLELYIWSCLCFVEFHFGLLLAPLAASLLTWENSSGVKARSGLFAGEITVNLGSECFQFPVKSAGAGACWKQCICAWLP